VSGDDGNSEGDSGVDVVDCCGCLIFGLSWRCLCRGIMEME
jgi:hypothetical protein